MFKNYLYVSGTTDTFKKHTKELAIDAVKRFKKKKLSVLDIACNDGTQLEYFRKLGCKVMGVDPAENLREITKSKNIEVIVDYWVPKVAEKVSEKFDIITGTNVFAHVDNLDEFLNACKIVLKDDGILILEFPYAEKMIEHNEFDTIYHEHLSYFLVNSFKTLAERMGFYIDDIMQTSIHGGSIRFFVKMGKKNHTKRINILVNSERKKGLLDLQSYKNFNIIVKKNKTEMIKLIKKINSKGSKIIGYGASAKGNTMLNYFKIKPLYIIDDNPLKCGFLTPGMNIPIVGSSVLKEEKEKLYVIVLAWNFYNEIARRIQTVRPKKMDFGILYVPTVRAKPLAKISRKTSNFMISSFQI